MLGGTLGIILTPILAYLWTTYSALYLTFGRAYFLVYLGCLVGLIGLDVQRRRNSSRPGSEKLGIRFTFVGLMMSLAGDIIAYWGGSSGTELDGDDEFTVIQASGFGVEMLGLLLLLVGSVILGVTYLRTDVLPSLLAWSLILAGPGGFLLSALHIPSGTMLLFCVAWVVLGYALWTGSSTLAQKPTRVR